MYTLSHDPFFKNMVLIFYMLIPYPFALKINTILLHKVNGQCFIFSLDNLIE
jgi:hypothetical protein